MTSSSAVFAMLGLVTVGFVVGVPSDAQAAPPDSSGPQTSVPAPLPSGQADVPGGSARNGVIKPPPTGGTMPVVQPPTQGRTPVIKPPGNTQAAPPVQPK